MSDDWCPLHETRPASLCGGPHSAARCHLCGGAFEPERILGHLRDDHQITESPELWPDGGVVMYDETGEMP